MKRIRAVNFEEINKILKSADSCTFLINKDWARRTNESLSTVSYVHDGKVNFEITTKWGNVDNKLFGKACTYKFRKDGEPTSTIQGQEAYIQMQRAWQSPTISRDSESLELRRLYDLLEWDCQGKCVLSARPILETNPRMDNQEIENVYCYDLNSAYAIQLMKPLPDTTHYYTFQKVGNNQVGFMLDDELHMVESGGFADIVFDMLNDSPLKAFAERWYKRKRTAKKGSVEKARAKAYLNYCVGYWQLKNPFLRAFVVHSCNKEILSLVDENTIHCNTDAIYSKGRRPDLEKRLGDEIGQFKIEHQGTMRIKGCCYQFPNENVISYRDVPQSWFKKYIQEHGEINILTDPLPENGNHYEYNKNTHQIEEIIDYEI